MVVLACRDATPDRARGPNTWQETLSSFLLTANDLRVDSLRIIVDSAIYRIGDPPRNALEEFGWFREAVLLDDGSAVLPDLRNRQLLAISPASEVALLAPVGEGPGEVRHPSTVYRTGPQQFDLLDNAIRRRTRFEVTAGAARLIFSAPATSQPHGACMVGSGFLAVEFDPIIGSTFARYDSAGRRTRAFGSPWYTGSRLGNEILTQGRLICDADNHAVLFASSLGDLLAFDSAGTMLWRRKLRDFRPHQIIDRGSSFQFGGLPDSAASVTSLKALLHLGQGVALVQYAVYVASEGGTNRNNLELARIESFLIKLETGREVGHQSDLAVVLGNTASQLLLVEEEPAPWVELRGYVLVNQRR